MAKSCPDQITWQNGQSQIVIYRALSSYTEAGLTLFVTLIKTIASEQACPSQSGFIV